MEGKPFAIEIWTPLVSSGTGMRNRTGEGNGGEKRGTQNGRFSGVTSSFQQILGAGPPRKEVNLEILSGFRMARILVETRLASGHTPVHR